MNFFRLVSIALGLIISAAVFAQADQSDLSTSTSIDEIQSLDLGELFRMYGSDKDINGYTSVYHTLFHPLQNQEITLLEIGIGTMIPGAYSSMVGYARPGYKPGGSLRAWRDYFPNGEIFGVDVQPDTQFSDEERIQTFIANSTSPTEVSAFIERSGVAQFDIIIDDGSHYGYDQLATAQNFYPYVKEGGFYIIEDINHGSIVATNPKLLSSICNGDPLFFVGLTNNICVVYKKHLNRPNGDYAY